MIYYTRVLLVLTLEDHNPAGLSVPPRQKKLQQSPAGYLDLDTPTNILLILLHGCSKATVCVI